MGPPPVAPGPESGYGVSYGDRFDLSSSLDISMGTPDGEPTVVRVDPTKEYVVAADRYAIDRNFLNIEGPYGGPTAWHGVEQYRWMARTPCVSSSFDALRSATLANEVNLLPAVKPGSQISEGAKKLGQKAGTGIESDMAAEIAASNQRLLDAWETPVHEVLWEFDESDYLGHVLGEIVAKDISGGPDDGMLAISSVKAKDRDTYRFRVDCKRNVIGIRALAIEDEAKGTVAFKLFEGESLRHFCWMTNDPDRGDPRGRSCFRAAHYHWRLLMDLWPLVWEGWKQFGIPVKYGTCAEGGSNMVPVVGKDGKPIPGSGVTREYAMAMQVAAMNMGKSGAGPFGSDVKVVESQKDASVAAGGIELLEGQIKGVILLAQRVTTEAKHGSKADGDIAQDVMGNLVRFRRRKRERWIRSLLIKQNVWNYGEDIARRLTPLVDLGGTEHQDFAANSAGVATLFQSSYFTKSQLGYVDTFLGLPQRQVGDDRVGPSGVIPDQPVVDPNAPPPPADGAEPGQPAPPPTTAEGATQ